MLWGNASLFKHLHGGRLWVNIFPISLFTFIAMKNEKTTINELQPFTYLYCNSFLLCCINRPEAEFLKVFDTLGLWGKN